jgi:hypothetical protein
VYCDIGYTHTIGKKMVQVVHWDVIEVVLKSGLKQLSASWLSNMVKVTVRGFGIHRYILMYDNST